MALNAAQQWWVRQGGDDNNAGGFDATISGAGVNYADQDSPQLSHLNLACAGGTAVVTGGTFTSNMVGNILAIVSGTNFVAGHYAIVTFLSSTQVTLDRDPTSGGAGSSGIYRVGGAKATLMAFASSSSGSLPSLIPTNLLPGNIINIRGSGTLTPSADDYYDASGDYFIYPPGDATNGWVWVKGYNGRPQIGVAGLWHYASPFFKWETLKFVRRGASFGANRATVSAQADRSALIDVQFDQNGFDQPCAEGVLKAINCFFGNSGSTSAGTTFGVTLGVYGGELIQSVFQDLCGGAISTHGSGGDGSASLDNLIIDSMHGTSVPAIYFNVPGGVVGSSVKSLSFYACASDAIEIPNAASAVFTSFLNNIFVGSGGYDLNYSFGSAAANDLLVSSPPDYNAHYGATSGPSNNITLGPNEITLSGDPFTNAASGDFSLNNTAGAGADCRASGLPGTFPIISTVDYSDVGAVQSQGGGGGSTLNLYAVE